VDARNAGRVSLVVGTVVALGQTAIHTALHGKP
jgi:hypothetical protein